MTRRLRVAIATYERFHVLARGVDFDFEAARFAKRRFGALEALQTDTARRRMGHANDVR
jgi:hypothetical protein